LIYVSRLFLKHLQMKYPWSVTTVFVNCRFNISALKMFLFRT